ncbi:IS5 family transposase [Rickettsia endosymbiont of Orchestes rusci]|uniref:IS5 family transposase n=1 Tax=Rickettsia endosymbiont of Orchestes rusci TaxID=3066250 RepID=UPI00313AF6E9
MDSQTVKNTQCSEEKGYDAGKKIKGVKCHIITDTNGLILTVNVHSASVQDRDGAKDSLVKAKDKYPSIERFFADGGYSGNLQNWCFLNTKSLLSVVKRKAEKFEILPIRWIVERTFGWLNNFRRLSKHYEHTIKSATNQIYIALIRLMLNRLNP